MSDLSTGNVQKGINDLVSMAQAEIAALERLLSTAGANALDGVRAALAKIETHISGIHHHNNNPGKALPPALGGPTPTAAVPATPAPVVNPVVPPQTILPPSPAPTVPPQTISPPPAKP